MAGTDGRFFNSPAIYGRNGMNERRVSIAWPFMAGLKWRIGFRPLGQLVLGCVLFNRCFAPSGLLNPAGCAFPIVAPTVIDVTPLSGLKQPKPVDGEGILNGPVIHGRVYKFGTMVLKEILCKHTGTGILRGMMGRPSFAGNFPGHENKEPGLSQVTYVRAH